MARVSFVFHLDTLVREALKYIFIAWTTNFPAPLNGQVWEIVAKEPTKRYHGDGRDAFILAVPAIMVVQLRF